jgi:hypothetical protein
VLVVMAIHAKVLPIGTVAGIVLPVADLVVDGQEMLGPLVELPAALGADQPVDPRDSSR